MLKQTTFSCLIYAVECSILPRKKHQRIENELHNEF